MSDDLIFIWRNFVKGVLLL